MVKADKVGPLTYKQRVRGSSPCAPTEEKLHSNVRLFCWGEVDRWLPCPIINIWQAKFELLWLKMRYLGVLITGAFVLLIVAANLMK
jgi:hypothetical protein